MPSKHLILCCPLLLLPPIFPSIRVFSNDSVQFSSVAQSCPTLWPHELQHTRPPCPSPTPGVHSNSPPSSRWCHPTISSSVVPSSSCLQSFPASESSNELTIGIRWLKYWSFSFSISPSNEFSGLISLRIDWFNLFAVQGTLKSHLQHYSLKPSVLWCSLFFSFLFFYDGDPIKFFI